MIKFVNPNVPIELKKEVYDYIVKLQKADPKITVDFRAFKSGVDARVGNPGGWKDMVKIIVGYEGKEIVENYLKNL